MTKRAQEKLVVVKNFPSRALAEAGRQFLKDNGIESVIQSSDMVGAGTYQGVDLYVQQNDVTAAYHMLDRLYDGI